MFLTLSLPTHKGKVYFHTRYTYPSPNLPLLVKDLQKAAIKGGDVIVNAGGIKSVQEWHEWQVIQFICQCSQIYRGDKFDKTTQSIVPNDNYRKEVIANKCQCNCIGFSSVHGPHKTSTTCRLSSEVQRCPFLLLIYLSRYSWFLCQVWHRQSLPQIPWHQYISTITYLSPWWWFSPPPQRCLFGKSSQPGNCQSPSSLHQKNG